LIKKESLIKFKRLISDWFSVKWNKSPSPEALGNFELLLDEELAVQDEREGSSSKYRSSSLNKWK